MPRYAFAVCCLLSCDDALLPAVAAADVTIDAVPVAGFLRAGSAPSPTDPWAGLEEAAGASGCNDDRAAGNGPLARPGVAIAVDSGCREDIAAGWSVDAAADLVLALP